MHKYYLVFIVYMQHTWLGSACLIIVMLQEHHSTATEVWLISRVIVYTYHMYLPTALAHNHTGH